MLRGTTCSGATQAVRTAGVRCPAQVGRLRERVYGYPVQSVNFRCKSLSAKTFLLQDANLMCGWPAQAALGCEKETLSREPRLLAQAGNPVCGRDTWRKAQNGNLKMRLCAKTTCGGFRRRSSCISRYSTSSWVENGNTRNGPKWSLKDIIIFKFPSRVSGYGVRVGKDRCLAALPAARNESAKDACFGVTAVKRKDGAIFACTSNRQAYIRERMQITMRERSF
jgi:hypothetical protein